MNDIVITGNKHLGTEAPFGTHMHVGKRSSATDF